MDKKELIKYKVLLLILIAEKCYSVKINLKVKRNWRNNILKIKETLPKSYL